MSTVPFTVNFGKRPIRTVIINGVQKFSATDICNILGYNNPNKIIGYYCNSTPEYMRLATKGGPQNLRMIDVADIRAILSHSRRKVAGRLRRWLDEIVVLQLTGVVIGGF